MLKIKKCIVAALLLLSVAVTVPAQTPAPGSVLIVYDSAGAFGWIGGLHAKMLANLMGHFELPYLIKPVENYAAGDMNSAVATFYMGTVYDNPLPAAFRADVMAGTNRVCWFKYNLWQIAGTSFESKYGFRFNWLDWSGYSNIVYKGESFLKNQLDPELGYVTVLDPSLASTPVTACKTNTAAGTNDCIPYAVQSGNFWYFADSPLNYLSEEDRYIAFADLLHDILGINHPESHSAIIRIEDVAPTMYTPAVLRNTANLLRSNNVPFAVALVPVYKDPLGHYNSGIPREHRISDAADSESVAFLSAIRYMVTNGAQLILHGYTHQYNSVANPYNGVSGDDFEFWRETFLTNDPNPYAIDLYMPVPEDSPGWVMGRINAAKSELSQVGLAAVGWEFPHYAASALDYSIFATNFPLVMERRLYFDDGGRVLGQFFPYIIHRDVYGQKIIPENIGNVEPTTWADYPTRLPADLIRAAKKNLVVRDGWANGYFHPFYDLTNLQAVVTGIKALGYTYVQVSPTTPPTIVSQPQSIAVLLGNSASFNVAAGGTSPYGYQWRFNGTNIAAANATSLVIGSAQANNAGNYTAVVTNIFGAVTSVVAVLTVNIPAIITAQPQSRTNLAGTTATFSVTATGTATLAYQWQLNGTNLIGATAATLTVSNVQPADAGGYAVIVTNAFGSATSAAATLTVVTAPSITGQPTSQTNLIGSTATFNVTATGTATLAYQWRFNNTNLAGATGATLALNNVQTTNVGNYVVVVTNAYGSITSAVATLSVTGAAPSIVTQPVSQTNVVGTAATFNVTAAGTGTLAYRWRFNGTNISGETGSSLTLNNVQTTNAGNYSVVVTNAYGSVTSAVATLTVVTAPAITAQPQNKTNALGSTATFNVTATGTATLAYQWQFNSTNVASATNSSLTLSNVQPVNVGGYAVVISNSFGSVTSAIASLIITGTVPIITTQPTNQTVISGLQATFSVTASGSSPLIYQWRFNGTNLAGATNVTLSFNTQAADAGNYNVIVGNTFGSITSAVATLTVVTTPAITAPPSSQTNLVGTTATFNVTATGTATLAYQWQFNSANITGETGSTLTLNNVQTTNAGNYTVVVTNAYGSITSAVATLTVVTTPAITTPPVSQTNVVGTIANFSATATGTAPINYQWQFNGTNLAGATNTALALANVQTTNAGSYAFVAVNAFGSATSAVATLTVVTTPAITSQPQNQTNALGTTATFSVTATGTATLNYQWRFNGTNIAGATGATFALVNVQLANVGGYAVVISNPFGSVTSAPATLTVTGTAPSIITQPASQSVLTGSQVTFSVTASGSSPLIYQWRFNGTNLAGATNVTLSFNTQAADAGNYSAVVGNPFGSVTSAPATLTLGTAPVVTSQPQSQTNVAGTTATFSVTAGGSATLAYQWQFNTANLAGATNATLALSNVQASNAGNYAVVITNTFGSTTSGVATLTFASAPTVTTQPQSQTSAIGGTATFTVVAGGSNPLSYQWRFNNANIAGATGSSLTLTNLQTASAGNYTVVVTNASGAVTSGVAALSFFTPPASFVGKTYRWQRDNNGLGGVYVFSTSTYTWTPNTGAATTGSYSLQLTNGQAIVATYIYTGVGSGYDMTYNILTYTSANAGTFIQWSYSAATGQWTLFTGIFGPVVTTTPPSITGQPASQSAAVSATVNFTVTAAGSTPLSYQWRFNSVNISGATGPTLALVNAQTTNSGNYTVVITNTFGSVTSAIASLTITGAPPTITAQPMSQTVAVGGGANFAVTAGGGSPLSYQWRFNGANMSGATSSTLALANLQTNNAGGYTVVITNVFGAVTSSVATLTVSVSTTSNAPASLAGLTYYTHDLDNNAWGVLIFSANGTWLRWDSTASGYISTTGYYSYSKTGPNSATLVVANSSAAYNYYVLTYTGAGVGTYEAWYVVNGQTARYRTGEFVKP